MSKSKSHKWQRACRMFPTYAGTIRRNNIASSAYVPEPLARLVTSQPRGTYLSAGFATSAAPTPIVQSVAPKRTQPGLRLAVADLVADVLIDRLLTPETARSPEHGNRQIPLLQIFIESTYAALNGALSRRDILEIVDQQIGLFAASGVAELARRKLRLKEKPNVRFIKPLTVPGFDVPLWNAVLNAEHKRLNALGAMYASRRASQAQAGRRGHKPEGFQPASADTLERIKLQVEGARHIQEKPWSQADQFKSRTMRKGE